MRWIDALREYSKKTGKFVVPKKGSAEYEAVQKIMANAKAPPPAPAPTPAPATQRIRKPQPTKKELVAQQAKIKIAMAKEKKPEVAKEPEEPIVKPAVKQLRTAQPQPRSITQSDIILAMTAKQLERLTARAEKKAEKARLRAEARAEKKPKVSIVHQPVEMDFT